jgi:hypothetical protein
VLIRPGYASDVVVEDSGGDGDRIPTDDWDDWVDVAITDAVEVRKRAAIDAKVDEVAVPEFPGVFVRNPKDFGSATASSSSSAVSAAALWGLGSYVVLVLREDDSGVRHPIGKLSYQARSKDAVPHSVHVQCLHAHKPCVKWINVRNLPCQAAAIAWLLLPYSPLEAVRLASLTSAGHKGKWDEEMRRFR